jgi:hypothetical protein
MTRTMSAVSLALALSMVVTAAAGEEPKAALTTAESAELAVSVRVTPVVVTNFPATQNIDGTVNVANLPAVQQVGGTVNVENLPFGEDGSLRTSPPGVVNRLLVLAVNVDVTDSWVSEPFDTSAYTRIGLYADAQPGWNMGWVGDCVVQWEWSTDAGFFSSACTAQDCPPHTHWGTGGSSLLFSSVNGLRGRVFCSAITHINRIEVLLRRE